MGIFWKIISRIFIWIWKLFDLFRHLVMTAFCIFLVIVIFSFLTHTDIGNRIKNSGRKVLLLNIAGVIVDKPSVNYQLKSISRKFFNNISSNTQENSLFDIVNAIRKAKDDYNITGIVLSLKNFVGADQPSMQYIGKALNEFRKKGKPIVAIGNNYNQCQYYLASFSDEIWLSPQGIIDLHGFSTNNLYYKSLFDKLKISTHVFRVGNYKSAIEPFIQDRMSSTVREANRRWINELWQDYLSTISINRQISKWKVFPGVKRILDELKKTGGNIAKYALNTKLVDVLGSSSEIEKALIKKFSQNGDNYHVISIYDYMNRKSSNTGDLIAVIFANGTIIDGEEMPGNVGSETIVAQMRDARLNPKVKAVVLRVNSPGGSVVASEIIREELMAIRESGKPIVVSMGGVAASGGYWITTPANYIIASPSTLTGSIGVFSLISTIENSLDYLGVHADGVATSPLADITITKKLPPEFIQMMQLRVQDTYKYFINLVAKSRKKTLEQIDKIAQGHIWTGKEAKSNGLIDSLGDFDDAIKKAAELAKLKTWNINYYQQDLTFLNVVIYKISNLIFAIFSEAIKTYSHEFIEKAITTVKAGGSQSFFNDLKS